MVNKAHRARKQRKDPQAHVDVEQQIFTWTSRLLGPSLCAVMLVLLLVGVLPEHTGYGAVLIGFYLFAALRVGMLVTMYLRTSAEDVGLLRSVELGSLLVTSLYVAIYHTGGQPSMLQPALYLGVAFLMTFFTFRAALSILAVALVFEVSVPLVRGEHFGSIGVILVDSLYLVLFALLPRVLLRLDLILQRQKQKAALDDIVAGIRKSAETFRWGIRPDRPVSAAEKEQMHDVAAHFEIHTMLREQLQVLRDSLFGHTCVLLAYDDKHDRLQALEAISDSALFNPSAFQAQKGFLGGVVSHRKEARTVAAKWNRSMLGYYTQFEPLYSVAAVPLLKDNQVKAVLCMDRVAEYEFSDQEMQVIRLMAGQIQRSIQAANLLRNLDRDKTRYYNLAEASKQLAFTHNSEDVLAVALEWTQRIAPFDTGALAIKQDEGYVVKASWPPEMGLTGMSFQGGSGLVHWSVSHGEMLSHPDLTALPKPPIVFSKEEELENVGSLLVLPITVQDDVRGAFVFLSSQAQFFTDEVRDVYQIFVNQLATSLVNAEMVSQLERLAVTDALTGLHNRRYLKDRLGEVLARAERHDKPVTAVMCDIDHFKHVNDTYGHPVGDDVIRRVADVLKGSLRKIDLVARYGGEEFVMLLDNTDADSAWHKADELRQAIAKEVFDTDQGPFSITMSFGLAVYPKDERTKDLLIDRADEALYYSKEHGRNQVTRYDTLP